MEVYILDPLLRRQYVIDDFLSLIWTERFNTYGEFEMVLNSTYGKRALLTNGTLLSCNVSYRMMEVKYVEDSEDSEGKRVLKVKGVSYEKILEDRVAMGSLASLTTTPKWVITDEPADVMRKVFHDICVTGILSTQDIIPFITEGVLLTASTIPEPVDPITVEIEPSTVYDVLKNIGEIHNLGFRILRNFDHSQLYFDVYSGNDKTTAQTTFPAVVFTPELDNLQNTTELTTSENAKNVAYVYSPAGTLVVYPPTVDPEVEGFERRVLPVVASDITPDNPNITAALTQRGLEELAKNRTQSAFDGEISQNSQYKYGRDYELGDVVEMRNADGVMNYMRVTEQIFVEDGEGERTYPTLTVNIYINSGSWLSFGAKVWSDFTTEVWADF